MKLRKSVSVLIALVLIFVSIPTTLAASKALSTPSFTISASGASNPVLKIVPNDKLATHCIIYRLNPSTGKYDRIAYTTKKTYTDTKWNVSKSGHISYRIQTVAVKNSKATNTSSVTGPKGTYSAKAKLKGDYSNDYINLSWNKVSGAKSYAIQRKADGEKSFTTVLENTTDTSYVNKPPSNTKELTYRVLAYTATKSANRKIASTSFSNSVTITVGNGKTQVSEDTAYYGTAVIKREKYSTGLTELNLSDQELTSYDINELSMMVNLTKLTLDNNRITDITALSKLTNLTELNLSNNQIDDLRPLENLTELKKLNLSTNQIYDITPLESLTGLTELKLYNNKIDDVSALSGLNNLLILNLSKNQIDDISPLKDLSKLLDLNLSNNSFKNLEVVNSLVNLQNLDIRGNGFLQTRVLQLTNLSKCSILY